MQMMRIAAVFSAVALAAPAASAGEASASPPAMEIVVRNQNGANAQVFAETEDGTRVLLGEVRRQTTRTVAVPARVGTAFRIRVHAVESAPANAFARQVFGAVKTAPIELAEGRTLTLVVADRLEESGLIQQ